MIERMNARRELNDVLQNSVRLHNQKVVGLRAAKRQLANLKNKYMQRSEQIRCETSEHELRESAKVLNRKIGELGAGQSIRAELP